MRQLLLTVLFFPFQLSAVDNMMINSEVKEVELHKNPVTEMASTPAVEPGVVIS